MNYPHYGKTIKILWLSALLALLLCLLFSSPAISRASETQALEQEKTRIITLTELNTLQMKLNEVSQSNGKLQNALTDWQTKLKVSQDELIKAKQELAAAQIELQKLRAESLMLKEKSTSQEQRLKIANESLKVYATEAKQERLRIKAQRNLWQGISVVLAVVAAVK